MPSETKNRLISSLSAENREFLISRSTQVSLPVRTVLYRAEEIPQYCYFPTSGMCSVVTSMEEGDSAEVGIIGYEGVVGALHLLGPGAVSTNAFVQLEGTALRVPFSEMQHAYRSSEEIRNRILEFVQEQAILTAQIAGCNRLHEAEERLARWLLMAQDRTHSEVLDFTQEFLGMMLGARRTTVTLMAGALHKAGLIEYQRGHVRILDRPNLEAAACDCYQVSKRLLNRLYNLPSPNIAA
jgi:CRP-like cAMP-binding protein